MTVLELTLIEMAILGSIVVIRNIISYSLNKEIDFFEKGLQAQE